MSDAIRPSTLKRATRSAALSGAALATAGALALTPVSPIASAAATARPATSNAQVDLTAASSLNPIPGWQSVFKTAGTNLTGLGNNLAEGPFTLLETIGANQLNHLAMLPDVLGIADSIWNNASAGIRAPFALHMENLNNTNPGSDTVSHRSLYSFMTTPGSPIADPSDLVLTLLPLTTTSTAGVLLGAVGPVAGPVVALAQDLGTSFNQLTGGQLENSLATLINTPASMAGAFLNGGPSINVLPLLDLLGVGLKTDPTQTSARMTFGGLLSQGTSMFGALTVRAGFVSATGVAPGALASAMTLSQVLSKAVRTGTVETRNNDTVGGTTDNPTSAANPPTYTKAGLFGLGADAKALLRNPLNARTGSNSLTKRLTSANQSLAQTRSNGQLVTAKLKTGDIAGAAKQVGDNLAQRGERMKQNVDRGLVKAGIKKEKPTPTK